MPRWSWTDVARRLQPGDRRSPEGLALRPLGAVPMALPGVSCSRTPPAQPIVQAALAAAPAPAGGFIPHGDHNPHHGGIVMMKGDDLHYEVVLDPTGKAHHVYF